MRPISTRAHGILDFLSVLALVAAPAFFEIGERITPVLYLLAATTLTYSLFTRYEWGIFRKIPMACHLALDISSGVFLALLGLLFIDELPGVRVALFLFGMFEVAVGMLTQTQQAATVESRHRERHLHFPRRSRHV